MAATRSPSTEIRADVWLDARRALWLASAGILVVADVHWGYVASHRARGNLLPEWGDDEIAARLRSLLKDYEPSEMVWLGDSLHALAGRASAEHYLGTARTRTTIVSGNHDIRWKRAGEPSIVRGSYFLHHGNEALEVRSGHIEIIGHHHPAVTWHDGAGGRLKLPALVDGSRRLILPAFSPWAAGTPWNSRLNADESLWAISPRRVFEVQRARTSD
jgi:metallophosphoesterase superfamily enzyme